MTHRSSALFGLPLFVWRLILAAAIVAVFMLTRASAADCSPPPLPLPEPRVFLVEQPSSPSWVFARSRYTHDPETGARVAQYAMKPPVEPLDDPRLVTSGYSRSRTVIRGPDGSVDTHYRVQNYGNGRGGMDAEWERFHDAWRGSTIAGGQFQAFYPPFYGYGYGYGGYPGPHGGGAPGFFGHANGFGYGPGFGRPDAGLLDPDAADGYRDERHRTPDRKFFNPGLPPFHDQDYRGN